MKAVFCITVLVFGILVAYPFNASAENYQQVLPTDKGTIKVGISTLPEKLSPGNSAKLKIDFLNGQTSAIQEHIDYTVAVTKDGSAVFGPIPLSHTSIGTITIPVVFKEKGEYKIIVDVQGILFQPIPSEKTTFSIMVGESGLPAGSSQSPIKSSTKSSEPKTSDSDKNTNSKTVDKVKTDAKTTKKTDTKTKKTDSKSTKKTKLKQNTKQ
ncbi:MAG: hypothetical protein HW420_134 [Candidatus Nitrosotenuis sp.]|nr:hypothetical protein [Candidatus Nitrosotenuis sp.]